MEVDGLAPLVGALRDAESRLSTLTPALEAVGRKVTTTAAPRAPRATGLLAGSVSASVSSGLLTFGSRVPYFVPVHFGRRRRGRIPARPWVSDAIRATTPDTLDTLTDHITQPFTNL